MKYLLQGAENTETLNILISFTNIESEEIITALHDHFVRGLTDGQSAMINGIDKSNFSRAIKRLNHVAGEVERLKEIAWLKFGYKAQTHISTEEQVA